jgi:hypothetical protein
VVDPVVDPVMSQRILVTFSINQPNDVADPKQICRMLGYVLLWLWTMQSEPLDGDASEMRAVISRQSSYTGLLQNINHKNKIKQGIIIRA